ncbi:diacylglycerol kinase family protein [Cypionkella psychrotolerans]|uniref:diacylglycerol kinase family protein n=1 Tax=Cypionkella psychrotolerans TaxID=1678131 RepID=UPI0009E7EFF7|nr:diacylglycerol kinase family protein [Cypionkella psychrotolerans]
MICCTLFIALLGLIGTALHKLGLRPASPLAWRPEAAAPVRFSWTARARSFRYAGRGLATALREEHNARLHLAAAVLMTALGLGLHFTAAEWARTLFAVALVFIAELLNTALEHLCDVISPAENPTIGKAKDVAAAAVLIAALTACAVLATILLPRLLPAANAICGG